MPKNTKNKNTVKRRTSVKDLSASEKKLSGREMKKVKGGNTALSQKEPSSGLPTGQR